MANQYDDADRDQLYLLPPSMRDWLPDDHLVWLVLDLVRTIDLSAFHARYVHSGPGRPAYHPGMMLALLIYAYANGVRSSRQIERLCSTDIAYRVICAGHKPDHDTIANFRAVHEEALDQVFVAGLRLCDAAGLASLGTVAIDGTKIAANAAMSANREAETIRAEAERILSEAKTADANQQDLFGAGTGSQMPSRLAWRSSRLAHLRAAQAELEVQQARAKAAAAKATEAARKAAEKGRMLPGPRPTEDPHEQLARAQIEVEVARQRAAQPSKSEAMGRRRPGRRPQPDAPWSRHRALPEAEARLKAAEADVAEAAKAAKVNVTDPQSRVMKTLDSFIQGYNAQGSVNQHQIILANDVTQDCNDYFQFVPMVSATGRNAKLAGIDPRIGLVLVDNGYCSEENATAPGPDRLISTRKEYKQRLATAQTGVCVGPPPADAGALEAMEYRLRTAEGAAAYALRSQTVEPVFGILKQTLGFRRFSRRGLPAVQSEWSLVCAVHNLLKVFRHRSRRPGLRYSPAGLALA